MQIANCLSSFHNGGLTRSRREFSLLIGIFVLAFGVRLAVGIVTTSWVFPSDRNFWKFGYEMGQIASSLAMGNGFSWPEAAEAELQSHHAQEPTAWMPPIYPFIMAATFKGFGIFSHEAAMVLLLLQAIISSLTCILLYLLGKRLYNTQVGLLAAFLLAIYPSAIHFAVQKIWVTSLSAFCLLLVILMFLRQADHPHMEGGAGIGILLGFAALVDPVIMGTYAFAFAWLWLKADGNRRTVTKRMAATLIALLVTISPWLVRNYIVFEQFVLIKSNVGNELFVGNNQYSTGSYNRPRWSEMLTDADREYLSRSNEGTRNNFLFGKAMTFIVEHPVRFTQLTMTRFVHYWTDMARPFNGWQEKTSLIVYFLVLVLAVVGLLLSKARGRNVQLVLLFLLSFPLPYYFTVVGLFRYRFSIEPILLIFVGYTLYWLAPRLEKATYAYRFFVPKERQRSLGVPLQPEQAAHIVREHVVSPRMD